MPGLTPRAATHAFRTLAGYQKAESRGTGAGNEIVQSFRIYTRTDITRDSERTFSTPYTDSVGVEAGPSSVHELVRRWRLEKS